MSEILQDYKRTPSSLIDSRCIPIMVKGTYRGRLRPITVDILQHPSEIKMIAEWREASADWFTTRFSQSEEGTRKWLEEQVLNADHRILFMVEDEDHTPVGQVGLLNYDPLNKRCEYDNLLRGRKGKFGNIMLYALVTLGIWSIKVLEIQEGYIQVVADNYRAIRIYQHLGAEELERVPLTRVEENGVLRWVPQVSSTNTPPERELVKMRIKRNTFLNLLNNHLPQ